MTALKDLALKYPKLAGLLVVLALAAAQYYGVPAGVVGPVFCTLAGVGC